MLLSDISLILSAASQSVPLPPELPGAASRITHSLFLFTCGCFCRWFRGGCRLRQAGGLGMSMLWRFLFLPTSLVDNLVDSQSLEQVPVIQVGRSGYLCQLCHGELTLDILQVDLETVLSGRLVESLVVPEYLPSKPRL